MPRKVLSLISWTYLAFIAFATLSPMSLRPSLIASTEPHLVVVAEHVGAFAVLGLLFSLLFPRRLIFICLVVFGSGVLLEFLQYLVPTRDARLSDALEKLGGGTLGILTGYLIHLLSQATRSNSAA
jgi:VanZ family protein